MSRTGLEDAYIMRGSKKLRMGYTTGSCAAAAARGAAFMLLSGKEIQEVKIHTPKGIVLNLELLDIRRSAEKVSCAVRKDGGDDPDVTDKALIYAEVTFGTEEGIVIDGGFGVGRVTSGAGSAGRKRGDQPCTAPDDPRECGGDSEKTR